MNAIDPLGLIGTPESPTRLPPVTVPGDRQNLLLEACQGTRGLNCRVVDVPLFGFPDLQLPNLAREIETIIVTACRVEGVSRCEAGENREDDRQDEPPICDTRPVFQQATATNVGYGPVSAVFDIQSASGIGILGFGLARALLRGGNANDLAQWNQNAYREFGLEAYFSVADLDLCLRAADAAVIKALRNDAATQARRISLGCRGRVF